MTGFGTFTTIAGKDYSLEMSLRTVNGRFLEIRFHLPREYMFLESDLKKILSEKVRRGTVDVFIYRKNQGSSQAKEMQINDSVIEGYLKALGSISKKHKMTLKKPSVDQLIRWPDVLSTVENNHVSPLEKKKLLAGFEKTVELCDEARKKEGNALRKILLEVLGDLEKIIKNIASLREEANSGLQNKLENKIKNRLKDLTLDPQRLAIEVVMQLERSDINEELDRLSEHFHNYKELLNSNETEGKKLDFYTQELLREVNTIGSKSQLTQITHWVVEAKTLIERLREQVQNVE